MTVGGTVPSEWTERSARSGANVADRICIKMPQNNFAYTRRVTQRSAGDFSTWLTQIVAAMNGTAEAVVPCGECTGCCTSSQFVHIEPDEMAALAAIPKALTFPAPGMPKGHRLMGYDERGHCPMLVDNRCSIYDSRPRTCRTYDCRILSAAGLQVDDDSKAAIGDRVREWVFDHPSEMDTSDLDAVKFAADFLATHRKEFPAGVVPHSTTQLAGMAIAVHDLFRRSSPPPTVDAVGIEITRRRRFTNNAEDLND